MRISVGFFLLIVAFNVNAQAIYKSVDEKGNVTYSSEPPKKAVEVKEVDLQPAPTDKQRMLSEQEQKNIKQQSEDLRNKRESAQRKVPEEKKEEITDEAITYERKSTINDPGRAGQQPKPSHPIVKPRPGQPITKPQPSQPIAKPKPAQ